MAFKTALYGIVVPAFTHVVTSELRNMTTQIMKWFSCKKPMTNAAKLKSLEVDDQAKYCNSPFGLFAILPTEIQFMIFSYLPVTNLSQLTVTSKALRNCVDEYASSETVHRRFFSRCLPHSVSTPVAQIPDCLQQFHDYGILLKRSTCLMSTKKRLKIALTYLQKYVCIKVGTEICPRPSRCLSLSCFGMFLHSLTAGWDNRERILAFNIISGAFVTQKHLQCLVESKQGRELQVRLFFRRAFLDQCRTEKDESLWLNTLLKPFPLVHQARLLFLLFGPISADLIQWSDLCDKTPATSEQTIACFRDIARAVRYLHRYSPTDWTEDATVSVLDEIMGSPDDWLPENIAGLLYMCGEKLTVQVLSSKAINGRIGELSAILLSLCVVCSRLQQRLVWVVRVLHKVAASTVNTRDRFALLRGVTDAFRFVINDLHQHYDPNFHVDVSNMLDVQAAFHLELMQMAFSAVSSEE